MAEHGSGRDTGPSAASRESTRGATRGVPQALGFVSRLMGTRNARLMEKTQRRKKETATAANVSHNQGTIRFPGSRRAPARWFKVRVDASQSGLVAELTQHYHVRPPMALLSVIGTTPQSPEPGSIAEQQQRSVCRAFKRAAIKMNAWVVTSGSSARESAGGWAGVAIGNSEIACIGVLPWRSVLEHAQLEWNRSHYYGNYRNAAERKGTMNQLPIGPFENGGLRSATGELPRRTMAYGDEEDERAASASCGRLHELGKQSWGDGLRTPIKPSRRLSVKEGQRPLDKSHSHFFLVDGDSGGDDIPSQLDDDAAALRAAFEAEVRRSDLVGVGLTTPILVVLVEGDGAALQSVLRSLKSGVPVVVLAGTGGAALDIAQWMEAGEELSSTDDPDPEYAALACSLIPQILAFASADSKHRHRPLLSFLDYDMMLHEDEVMDLNFMHATLAGSRSPKEEVALAVAWGEAKLLERVLQSHEGSIAAHPAALSQAGRDPFGVSKALNLALLSGSPTMMGALIDFGASSAQVDLGRIFVQPLNRYRLKGSSSECWIADGPSGTQGSFTNTSMSRRRLTKFNLPESNDQSRGQRQDSDNTLGDSSVSSPPPSQLRTKSRRSSMKNSVKHMMGLGDGNVDQDPWRILAEWVPHYKSHIAVRKSRNLLHPIWDDLMLWAVLTRETSMVKPLWARSREPMRLALSASHFCQRLAALPHLRSEHETLRQQAVTFEDWAISLLDAIDDSEAAVPLLTMIPCIEVGNSLWSTSTLDLAAEQEIYAGSLISCKRFVAHRHSQFVLEAFFAGDYPRSQARLHVDVGFVSILVQALCFFAPGAICEILQTSDAVMEEPAESMHDHTSYKVTRLDDDDNDDDADEEALMAKDSSAFQVIGNAGRRQFTNRISTVTRRARNSNSDRRRSLLSDRWRTFFLVPKVKFVMYGVMHLLYIGLLCLVVFPNLQRSLHAQGTATVQEPGSGGVNDQVNTVASARTVGALEIFFWLWTALFTFAELKEFRNFQLEGVRQYLRSPWNKLDLVSILSVLGACLLRTTCRPALDLVGDATKSCELSDSHWARNFYAITLILLFLKLLSYAQIYESVGVHVIILGEVIRADVSVFAVLALIISTGVGTALTVEFDAWISAELNDPSRDFFERPLTMPFWGIVGYFNHYNLPNQAGEQIQRDSLLHSSFFYTSLASLSW